MRGIERKFKVSRHTVVSWLKIMAKERDLKDTLIEPDEDEVIEVDEMCSFVFSSIFKVWIWIAIARHKAGYCLLLEIGAKRVVVGYGNVFHIFIEVSDL